MRCRSRDSGAGDDANSADLRPKPGKRPRSWTTPGAATNQADRNLFAETAIRPTRVDNVSRMIENGNGPGVRLQSTRQEAKAEKVKAPSALQRTHGTR